MNSVSSKGTVGGCQEQAVSRGSGRLQTHVAGRAQYLGRSPIVETQVESGEAQMAMARAIMISDRCRTVSRKLLGSKLGAASKANAPAWSRPMPRRPVRIKQQPGFGQ
ncbi:hypothetical protein NPX13_g4199 [Xylaria arbuscula]|uniref:Uncharacterized protein n=1 Tax=Xylaria arbuscula TaxID=114810 RepID=A0A9W8TMG6_9PEZI|nr:hypothetical protein NPX13_g4199 [Xylaria arbuscula]